MPNAQGYAKIFNELNKPKQMNKISREQAVLYQDFFNFLSQEHNLTCTIEEMDEIIHEAQTFVKKFDIADVVDTSVCDEPDEPIQRCKCCKSFHEPDVCCYD